MRQRTHPFTIMVNLWRVFYLVIFPVIRGFVTAIQGGFSEWLQGAWFDILVLFLMIGYSWMQWRRQSYLFDEKGIEVTLGLFVRRDTYIHWDRVSSVSLTSPFLLKWVRVATLRIDTLGGSHKDADVMLYLSSDKAGQILHAYREYEHPSSITRRYQPKAGSILAMGFLDSNSLAGILFLSTFISQSGRLLGKEFSDMIIGTFENLTRALEVGIPPAAAAIAYIAIAGWLIAFFRTVLRYLDFHLIRRNENISIKSGRFTQRHYLVDFDHINFINIRQTIGTKILKTYSLYISAIGYGKGKNDIDCVLPPEKETVFEEYRKIFFPNLVSSERQVVPKPTGFLRFLSHPLYLCIGIPIVMAFLIIHIPSWRDFILFVGLMSMAPSLLFFTVRWLDFRTGGIGRRENCYTLRYSTGFQLHTVVVPANKVVNVELRQSFFQQFAKNCDLYLYTPSERRSVHRCRNLCFDEIQEFFLIKTGGQSDE